MMDFLQFDFKEFLSAFVVLFAIIDITGAIPIIIDQNNKTKVSPIRTASLSLLVLILFMFFGEGLLAFFSIDISSFAVAGSIVLMVLAVEMLFGVTIMKDDAPQGFGSVVPLVFPLIAGPGTLTAVITLRAESHILDVIAALVLNMVVVFVVMKYVHLVEKALGKGGIYILRKFFGIILLAMSFRMFVNNAANVLSQSDFLSRLGEILTQAS